MYVKIPIHEHTGGGGCGGCRDTIEVRGGVCDEGVDADADAASERGATRCCERGECPRMWG